MQYSMNITASGAVNLVPGTATSVRLGIAWKSVMVSGGTGPLSGSIKFDATPLPSGVTATFTPSSLAVTAGTTTGVVSLELRAAATAPPTSAPVNVGASGVYSASTTINVSVSRLYGLAVGSSGETQQSTDSTVSLAAYGNVSIPITLEVASGVTGTISLAMTTPLPSGISAQFQPANFAAPQNGGTLRGSLVLTAGASLSPGTAKVSFAAQVGGATRAVYTFPLILLAPFISNVSPSTGSVPMLGQGGTQVTITGGGFGPGTTVTFGADTPVAPTSIAPDGTSLVVVVPPNAASGQLVVTSPAGAMSGAPPSFAVNNYRNTSGFAAFNSDVQIATGGNYTFDDATALFGSSQTEWTVFESFESPFCAAFLLIADAALDSGGQCFGMCLASLRFIATQQSYRNFPLQPAAQLEVDGPNGPDVWQLAGPPPDNASALTSYIHQQHLAQLSVENIANYLNIYFSSWSAANLRTAVQNALASGFGAMIAVSPSIGQGHVLVAYEIVDRDNGNFDLHVYNCNSPFQTNEDNNAQTRLTAANNSVIKVTGGGSWTLQEPNWTGGMSGVTVIPWGTIPAQPTAPFTIAEIATLATYVLWVVFGAATVTQVDDGQGHFLLANSERNMDPKTALAGVAPMPNFGGLGKATPTKFVSKAGGSLTHTVTGNAEGSYEFHWTGSGHALVLTGVPAEVGKSDRVVTDPAALKIEFIPGSNKPVNAAIIGTGTTSKFPRTAALKTTASANAAVTLSFDPAAETFTYTHAGAPTSYTLELSSPDAKGAPTIFATAPAAVATGDTITFHPDWTQLASGVGNVQLRAADGTVTNRTLK